MTNEISTTAVDKFMAGPLVKWFASCLDVSVKDQLTYEDLTDGVSIHDLILQMDVDGHINDVSPSQNNPEKQLANLETVMRHIHKFYEDYHGELILHEPNVRLIVQDPTSNVREVELLLVLLLGCAVKCRNNEHFIEKITLLDNHTQTAIADYVTKIMYLPDIVLGKQMLQFGSTVDIGNQSHEQELTKHKQSVDKIFSHLYRIYKERNELLQQLQSASLTFHDVQRYEKELKEWKSEAITLNDQLDEYKCKIAAIESENKRLTSEAKSNRDLLEDYSNRLKQTESLEQEVIHYKKKLENIGLYKTNIDELEKKNRLLRENEEELNDQLKTYKAESKRKIQEIKNLKKEICKLQERCDELMMENKASCEENSKLCLENADLREHQIKLSTSMNFTLDDSFNVEADDESINACNSSIGEQLSQSAQSHVLKLELENRRLETLKENSILESSHRIIDLENEKKRLEFINEDLRVKISQLQENLTAVNKEKMQLTISLEDVGSEELKARVAKLEFEKKNNEKIIEDLRKMKLQNDEDRDDDLNNSILKSPPKHKVKYDQLYNDYQSILQEKISLEKQLIDAKLKWTSHININSADDLSQEYVYLKEDFSSLMNGYSNQKSKIDELIKRHADCQKNLHARNVKILELDVQNRKLRNNYELLTEMKDRAESDSKMMKLYVSQLMKENRHLATTTLEIQQQFHDEVKKKNEEFETLTRSKERLENKVMDHYRSMSNRQEPKKNNVVKKTFVKVRRAGSEFFGISNKSSSTEKCRCRCNKTLDNTSRESELTFASKPRNNKSVDFLDNFSPEDFSFNNTKENDRT